MWYFISAAITASAYAYFVRYLSVAVDNPDLLWGTWLFVGLAVTFLLFAVASWRAKRKTQKGSAAGD
jgi:hypothetical protein